MKCGKTGADPGYPTDGDQQMAMACSQAKSTGACRMYLSISSIDQKSLVWNILIYFRLWLTYTTQDSV